MDSRDISFPSSRSAGRAERSPAPVQPALAWLWYNAVVARTRAPLWVLCLGIFLVTHLLAVLSGWAAGDIRRVTLGPQAIPWVGSSLLVALCAFVVGYAPRALDRVWDGVRPWVTNTEEEIAQMRAEAPRLLTRPFLWSLAFWVAVFIGLFFLPPEDNPFWQGYPHPEWFKPYEAQQIVLQGYLFGAATAIALGLGFFTRFLSGRLRLTADFIQRGGAVGLRPVNQLVRRVWLTFTLPFLVFALVSIAFATAGGESVTETYALFSTLSYVGIGAIVVVTFFVPQLFVNHLLGQQKERELRALHHEMEETAAFPKDGDPMAAVPRLLRYQHLTHRRATVEEFVPTLVNTEQLVELGATIGGVILLHVLFPYVLEQVFLAH